MQWEKIKPSLWGAIGGAILMVIIGFAWGGWVTGGTAHEIATEKAENAVTDRLAKICFAQFNLDSEKSQKLKELEETDSWKRGDYVEKQGWATMPTEEKADRNVADECVKLIMQINQ